MSARDIADELRARLAASEERAMCAMAEADDLRAEVEKWRTTVGAVMPADLKCWHQNSPAEWPEVAAHTIRRLREDRDSWLEQADARIDDALQAYAERDVLAATAARARRERDDMAQELARYRPAGWLMTRPDCDGSADWWEPGDAEPSPEDGFVAVRLYRADEGPGQ